VKNLVKN
jgi:hypothetical protein